MVSPPFVSLTVGLRLYLVSLLWNNLSPSTERGFPRGATYHSVRNSPANARDTRDTGLIPGSGRRAQQPTPVVLPGKFHGQRSLVGYSPRDCKELDTTGHVAHGHTGPSAVQVGCYRSTQGKDRLCTRQAGFLLGALPPCIHTSWP